uniref:Uncharacterized protein n=1 Tax=Arundo donax TaxID=35708 RepID=A0A0A8YM55_ARUDO
MFNDVSDLTFRCLQVQNEEQQRG